MKAIDNRGIKYKVIRDDNRVYLTSDEQTVVFDRIDLLEVDKILITDDVYWVNVQDVLKALWFEML